MKIIWEGYKGSKSHAWDEEEFGESCLRWALCGVYVNDTKSDEAATEVTCRTCLRILATRGLDAKL